MLTAEQKKDLQQYLEDHQDELVRLTQQLCAFATENPPGREFEACVDFMDSVMREEGLATRKLEVPKAYQEKFAPKATFGYPRFNLISFWDTGGSRTLHFNSHYDVVPATEGWKTDPYQPVAKGNRLYGRGTMDMKGCLAASIFAVKALRACGLIPAWNVELSFVADEEIGGLCGTGYIVRQKLVKPDAAVVCEGGMDEVIMYGHRGVLWAEINVRGVAGHGSNPYLGINAFEKGIALAQKFQEHHREVAAQRCSEYTINPPKLRYPTMTIGGVSGGGDKTNIIPDHFFFTIDRRLLPEESARAVQQEYREVVRLAHREDKHLKAQISFPQAFNAGLTDPKSIICDVAKKAVRSVLDQRGKLQIFGAFTDLHFFTNYAKCPTVGYGVRGQGLHGNREYLEIKSLLRTARVYAEMAMNMP